MSPNGSRPVVPLSAYREPPNGLSMEWDRIYRILIDPQGPRIKLGLIFLGGIERNKGCANDAVEIAPVTEETHVTRVIAYPASHQRILRPLA